MIEPGKHVKYFLRNGMVLEGIVEKDTAAEVILQSLDGKSLMILHKPSEDIMMTKVVLEEESDEPIVQDSVTPPADNAQEQVRNKLHETLQIEDPDLQKMSIEELRQLVVEQDRQLIENKKREHFGTPGNAKLTEYSTPFIPRRTVGRRVVYEQPRSAYQPGKLPSWVYGRPPKGK